MINVKSIYTTISNHKIHIAADTQYIGSIDSYNNCFTQFFAWLFGRSMTVTFDGTKRCVNKESYSKLLFSLTGIEKIDDLSCYSLFRPVAEKAKLPANSLKMRDVIRAADSQALFRKLAEAISSGKTEKAQLMIGKGAALDTTYYDRGKDLPPSFRKDDTDLLQSKYSFKVFHATPLLQAAYKGNNTLVESLKEAGASFIILGKKYTFNREILDVRTEVELSLEPKRVTRKQGNRKVSYIKNEPKIKERTVVTLNDSRTPEKYYGFDAINNRLVKTA